MKPNNYLLQKARALKMKKLKNIEECEYCDCKPIPENLPTQIRYRNILKEKEQQEEDRKRRAAGWISPLELHLTESEHLIGKYPKSRKLNDHYFEMFSKPRGVFNTSQF